MGGVCLGVRIGKIDKGSSAGLCENEMKTSFVRKLLLTASVFPIFFVSAISEEEASTDSAGETAQETAKNAPAEKGAAASQHDGGNIKLIKKITETLRLGAARPATQEEIMQFLRLVIQKTIENNKDLRQARYEVLRGMGAIDNAHGEFLPSANLVAGYTAKKENDDYSVYNNDGQATNDTKNKKNQWDRTTGLEVTYNLFSGFGSVAQVKAANCEVRKNIAEYKMAEADKVYQVLQKLLEIVTLKVLVQENEAGVIVRQEMLKESLAKMKVGSVDRTDVAFAEGQCALAEARLMDLRNKLDSACDEFARWSGLPANDIKMIHPEFCKFLPRSIDEMQQIAKQGNNEIQSKHYASLAKKFAVARARAGFSPTIDISASLNALGRNDHSFNKKDSTSDYSSVGRTNRDLHDYSIAVQVKLPLDTRGTARTNVTGARHDRVKAEIAYAQACEKVSADIIADLGSLERAKKIVESYARQVKAQEISLQCHLQELAVGAAVHTQVLKTLSDLLDAQGDLMKAKQAVADLEMRLLKHIGRLNGDTFGAETLRFEPLDAYDYSEKPRNRRVPPKGCSSGVAHVVPVATPVKVGGVASKKGRAIRS
jgi:outer membrane protein TolC